MSDVTDFGAKRGALLGAYDLLLRSALLPIEGVSEATLRERADGLRGEVFRVAVCGQMNAGKSTLLNALIFRAPVLPIAATVMTAKVTALRYREKPGFEAVLYDHNEWETVRRGWARDEKLLAQFDADVSRAELTGARTADWVTREGRVVALDGYERLPEFVSVPRSGGSVSPFVKAVTVYHGNPAYRDVTLVDTPGVNDPNAVREAVTREWIKAADAVVYVTYAGQAGMSDADVRFVDENLLHVAAGRRLIAVNKVDTVREPGDVLRYLERLRTSSREAVRTVFQEATPTVLVSGAGALVARMLADGLPLSEKLEELRELLAPKGALEANGHGIDRLETEIGRRLMSTRGDALLASHRSFLQAVFTRAHRAADHEDARLREEEDLASKSAEELTADIEAAKVATSSLASALRRFEERFDDARTSSQEDYASKINQLVHAMETKAWRRIEDIRATQHFASEVSWIVKGELEGRYDDIVGIARKTAESVRGKFEGVFDDLESSVASEAGLSAERFRLYVRLSGVDLLREAGSAIETALSSNGIAELVKEQTWFPQRLFDTKAGLGNIRSALKQPISEAFNQAGKIVIKKFEEAFGQRAENASTELIGSLRAAAEQRAALVRELRQKQEDPTQRLLGIAKRRVDLAERIAYLERVRSEVESVLGGQ